MQSRHDELRDELVAILGAGRDLSAATDQQLADAFIHYLERRPDRGSRKSRTVEESHQPHWSLKVTGAAWGAALMLLVLLHIENDPGPLDFAGMSLLVLGVVALLTQAFLFLARCGWKISRVEVAVRAPTRTAQSRR